MVTQPKSVKMKLVPLFYHQCGWCLCTLWHIMVILECVPGEMVTHLKFVTFDKHQIFVWEIVGKSNQ